MCLLIAVFHVLPDLPLAFAGNRDERFDRAAEPMAALRAASPRTLGGRDLVGGGTWLAVNEHGVVAGLTNKPAAEGADPTRRTRGELPLALTAAATAEEAVATFADDHRPGDYNPAWLLVGDRRRLYSIDMTGTAATVQELPPGVHVLENNPLGAPSPKVDRVQAQLDDVVGATPDALLARLRDVVADHRVPDGPEPPEPDGRRRPPALRAACVHTADFGTRWSGLVHLPADGGARPVVAYADGPPCRTAFVDATPRWA